MADRAEPLAALADRIDAAAFDGTTLETVPFLAQVGLRLDPDGPAAARVAAVLGADLPGPGDVERALVEWLSLLRHVRGAPDLDLPSWRELKEAAVAELARQGRRGPLSDLPELPANVLQRPARHGIPYAGL